MPEDFFDPSLAGAVIEVRLSVKDCKGRELPDLDDDLVMGLNVEEETLEELTERIRNEAREVAENEATNEYNRLVLDALEETATVQLPPLIVEHGAEHAWEERLRFLTNLGIRMEDFVHANETSEEELRGIAMDED